MNWWLSTSKELKIHLMASCYIGPIVFFLGLYKVPWLKPYAAIILIFGNLETMLLWTSGKINTLLMIASIVLHGIVYLPFIQLSHNKSHIIHTLILGTITLLMYRIFNVWPYQMSPFHTFTLIVCVILAIHF